MRGQLSSMPRRAVRAGFTLIEMLLALALVGILFGAITFLLGTVTLLWLGSKQQDFFPQHVEGVTLFLNESLRRAESVAGPSPASAGDQGGGQTGGTPEEAPSAAAPAEAANQSLPVEWARPPGWNDIRDPLLLFRQKETPALFVREGESLPNINCYLYWEDGEGLSILWYSDLEEEVEDPDDLFRTPISPYVTKVEYCYYDAERDEWEIEESPETASNDRDVFLLPQFLKLTFTYEDRTFVRNLYLPQRSLDAPLF